jgi:hypothetical protein
MPQPKPKLGPTGIALVLLKVRLFLMTRWQRFKIAFTNAANRRNFAYLFMISFILLTSVGAGLIFIPAGLIVAGITCGLFGFLLGSE